MIDRAPDLRWTPDRMRLAVRGRLVVKVASGEAPDRVPHALDVASAGAVAPHSFDGGGALDRAVRRLSPAMRVTRVFQPAARVGSASARLSRLPHHWSGIEDETGLSRTFRIDVDPDADLLALVQEVGSLGVVEQVGPAYLSVTPFAVSHAPNTPNVPNAPNGSGASDPWYPQRMVRAAQALDFEAGDSTLIVAIVDSGVDLRHPELEGSLRPGIDTVDLPPDQVPRAMRLVGDFTRPDRVPDDVVGHGTACAGIIAARGDRLPHGLAGAARVLPARALAGAQLVGRKTRTARGSLVDIDHAMKCAIDLGARVLNLSFGTPESSLLEHDPRPHADVVDYARRRGCVLVAASGNSGSSARYYPSCLDGVIAVGAVGPDARPAHFMTRGDHVDVCAPGVNVVSSTIGGGYQENTGTSFAAPFVAGAAALLVARAARYSESLGGEAVRELLKRTARTFPRGAETTGCGAGILDAEAALRALDRELGADADAGADAHDDASGWVTPVRDTPAMARSP